MVIESSGPVEEVFRGDREDEDEGEGEDEGSEEESEGVEEEMVRGKHLRVLESLMYPACREA